MELARDALGRLGEWELDAGRFAKAEQAFRSALEGSGGTAIASRPVFGLCMSLRRQGRLHEAIGVLERHLNGPGVFPGMEEALYTLGYLHLELGERDTALRHLRSLVERFPSGLYGQRAMRHAEEVAESPQSLTPILSAKESARESGSGLNLPSGHALTTSSLTGSNLRVDELR